MGGYEGGVFGGQIPLPQEPELVEGRDEVQDMCLGAYRATKYWSEGQVSGRYVCEASQASRFPVSIANSELALILMGVVQHKAGL